MAQDLESRGAHFSGEPQSELTSKMASPAAGAIPLSPAFAPRGAAAPAAQEKAPGSGVARKVVGAIVAVLLVAYVGVAVYFTGHFMPRTTLNGSDVSLRSTADVSAQLAQDLSSYSTTVSGDGIDLTIAGSDVGVTFDAAACASKAISQLNAWAWPVALSQSHDLTVDTGASVDEAKLSSTLQSAIDKINENATKPSNATIGYSDDAKSFVVVPEVYGTAIDSASAISSVESQVKSLDTTVTLGDESLEKPSVLKDNPSLQTAADAANVYLKPTITLTIAGTTVFTVDANTIKSWVTLGDDLTATLDTDAITTWAKGDLSGQLDTVGTTRTYTRPSDGASVTVSGGSYGWTIDGESLASQLSDNIKSGTSTSIAVPTKTEGAVWAGKGAAEWGKSFVDIDLDEQHVCFFDASGALAWESDCVTGNTSQGHGTPEGVYSINSNMQSGNVKLVGDTNLATGEPEYISYVTYWMPFIDNGYPLHDASWRSSFGGSIYKTNGSHGCVNLPSSKAAELYGMVGVGTVVVVHN